MKSFKVGDKFEVCLNEYEVTEVRSVAYRCTNIRTGADVVWFFNSLEANNARAI